MIAMNFKSAILLPLGFLFASQAGAQVAVYVSPNEIQSAEASGILGVTPAQIFTETFDDVPLGSINGYHSAVIGGSYTTATNVNVMAPDQYGGGGDGQYLGTRSNSSATLTLETPAQYFGIHYTAADKNNHIEIYSGNTLLLSFDTSTLISMLPKTAGAVITAINGDNYLTRDYYGQPTTNNNSGQIYAYLHFVTTGDVTFDRVVISQQGSNVFESDNHSVLSTTPVIPDSLVVVAPAIPEPSSMLLSLLGIAGFLMRRKR